jgi:very-short-patch-repair endonuclease
MTLVPASCASRRERPREVDGPYRQSIRSRDARRERKLERLGYRMVRLEAELVLCSLAEAVAGIRAALF